MAQRNIQSAVIDTTDHGIADTDLSDRYVYRNREAVQAFLAIHPGVVAILREAEHEVDLRFGERTTVTLDVIDDPEINPEPMVFGFIRTSLTPRDALDRLHRLDDEWWITRSVDAKDQLLFSIEFGK